MSVSASIHLEECQPSFEHRVFGRDRDSGSFVTFDVADGKGGRLTVFTNKPDDLWSLASAAGAAAGAFARQLRADEAAQKAMNDTDPEPPLVIYAPDLGGES